MGRKVVKVGLVAALAGVAGLAFVFASNRPISVPVAALERNVTIQVYGLGTVEARILSKIGFEVGAELAELSVDDGDVVASGQVLARLDQRAQEAKVARANAAINAAAANLGKAEANVEKAAAVLAQRRAADARQQELLGRNVISRQVAEEAKRDVEVAAAELTVARTDIDVIQSEAADARAALDYETAVLEQHLLKTPYDAVVVDRHVEAGTVVRAGDVIYTLMDPKSVWVLAYIDEERAGALSIGQPAEIRLRSMPHDGYTGKVARIGIESDRVNEERRVWVTCDSCPQQSFLGEQAEVVITVAERPEALLVPEDAIAGFDGHQGRVFLVQDGKLSSASLIFGHRTQDARVEVISELPDGARIVTVPAKGLAEGRMARAAEESRP
ncbi:efflux RND transporter periplasmic adaptor subunit [Rhizobium sp. ARZ01]|nr:efflux RND transporter periplasmic adaptor subunit [Rhizobium sp. ARZ01]